MNKKKRKTKKEMKRNFLIFSTLLMMVFLVHPVQAELTSGRMINVDDDQTATEAFYSTAGEGYTDSAGGNPNFKFEVCSDDASEDLQGKYATLLYAVGTNDSDMIVSRILGGEGASDFAPLNVVGNCANVSSNYYLITGRARYPGKLWIAVADEDYGEAGTIEDVPGGDFKFVFIDDFNLLGSYPQKTSAGALRNNYNPGTGNVTGLTPGNSATVIHEGGSTTTTETDSVIALGICLDESGEECTGTYSGTLGMSSVSLYTGVSDPLDTDNVRIRYFVTNGLATEFCIGPQMEVMTVSDEVILSGESINLTVNIKNNGNVDVNTTFSLTMEGPGGFEETKVISDNFSPGESRDYEFEVTPPVSSGNYNYVATINHSMESIKTCGPQVSQETGEVIVGNVITPNIWINDTLDGNFTYAGKINNVTIQLNDTDGSDEEEFAGWTVRIRELNSYNIFTPLQSHNSSDGFSGLNTTTIADLLLNNKGYGQFTLSPMGNLAFNKVNGTSEGLYEEHFSYPSLEFKIYDNHGNEQNVMYKEEIYLSGNWIPFDFEKPYEIKSATIPAIHDTITPNAEDVLAIWSNIRQAALSLFNKINIS